MDEAKGQKVISMCLEGRGNRDISSALNTPVTKINDFLLRPETWGRIMDLASPGIEALGDIQARLDSGVRLKQIAMSGDVSFRVLKLYCKKNDIKGPRRLGWEAGRAGVNDIIKKLRSEGLSNHEIAARLKLKPRSVALRAREIVPYKRQDYWSVRGVPSDFHERASSARTVYELKEHYRCSMANMRVLLTREGFEPPQSPYWTRRPVNPQEVLAMYESGMTLLQIKRRTGSMYADVKSVLTQSGISLLHSKGMGRRQMTFMSENRRRSFGSKRMRHPIDISVERFPDLPKLKKVMTRARGLPSYPDMTTEVFDLFVGYFYHDPAFSALFCEYSKTGERWACPSIDHKTAYTDGGDDSLPNLQALSWFENFVKHNRSQDEWFDFLEKHHLQCDLLTKNVLSRHQSCVCQAQARHNRPSV